MEKLKQQPLIGLAFAIATGILLAKGAIATYEWAWYYSHLEMLWLLVGAASLILVAIRFRANIKGFCLSRRGAIAGCSAAFVLASYLACVAYFSAHR